MQVIRVDDRAVAVDCWGDPQGIPIFLLHGTPGSRRGPRLRTSVLYRLGIRLISYDRPGYGESDPQPGRTVADAAWDVQVIADELKVPEFGVVGRSGGAPHALACAALLEDRVFAVAALVGLAPSDAERLDWYEGMTQSNVDEHSAADASLPDLRAWLIERANQIRDNPEFLLHELRPELRPADLRVVDDVSIRGQLTETYAEALRRGAEGWIDDALALRRPWGFELSKITRPQVLLWHGAEDGFSPVGHTRWLADQIPTAHSQVQPGASHFSAIEALPDVLAWMKKQAPGSEGLRVQRVQQPAFSS